MNSNTIKLPILILTSTYPQKYVFPDGGSWICIYIADYADPSEAGGGMLSFAVKSGSGGSTIYSSNINDTDFYCLCFRIA